MKYLNKSIKSLLACLVILALGSSTALAAKVRVSLSAAPSTIDTGQSTTLSWSATSATSCSASWTSSTATSGSQSVSPSTTTTYSINCTDGRRSTGESVTVTVNVPPPTASLSASPSTIDEGQSATLNWSSTDASSCSASWTSSTATSGSESVSPVATTTYNISCDGDGGSASNSVDVTVNTAGGGYDLVGDYIGGTHDTQVYDTSFAVEFSYSCLTGGCHENDQQLVDEYAAANMTHTMVKCNACHGTHTADTVGLEKPNLTGHYPGIGATGYIVGTDRCKTCHSNQHTGGRASKNDCKSCHTPHVFAPPNGGSRW
ncbi:MAG: hypothetical protein DIZ80_13330 [endosymbiont of Galathealinum brachiosum]|uniref:Uncharacterized protein n=1 Tax=endosymbiont of Galathealinum brachiosum TaxID=2200906 RepID=A0A370D844_9GAMM|nr:MAG: hypothetical protein DIZ80_13330 [endosymbiont of Galathealinum brachiosum]